jgi:hypothetical protein
LPEALSDVSTKIVGNRAERSSKRVISIKTNAEDNMAILIVCGFQFSDEMFR